MGQHFGGAGRGHFMRRNRRDAYLDLAPQSQSRWAGQDHGRVYGRPRVGTGPDRQPRPAHAPAIPPPRRPALEPGRRFGRVQRRGLSGGGGPGWRAYRLPSAHHRRVRLTGKTQSVGACHRSLLFRLDRRPCLVRRPRKISASLPWSRCCATPSATSCTTISASTKTKTCR